MDHILAHDAVIEDLQRRPIPTACPSMADVLLFHCAQRYGVDAARGWAIAYLRRQRSKGLATYGRGLTVDCPIDPSEEFLEEVADACCYEWMAEKIKEPATASPLTTEDLEFDHRVAID